MTLDLNPISETLTGAIENLRALEKPAPPSPDLLICRSDGGRSLIFLSAYSSEGQAFLNTRTKAMLRDHPAEIWAVIEATPEGLQRLLHQARTERMIVLNEEDMEP
jgi:hypothetical protein